MLTRLLLILLVYCLAAAVPAYAQPKRFKGFQTSNALKRAVWRASQRPDIRLSVARLDHQICMDLPPQRRPHSTAFLFKTHYKGKPEVWALTAGHVTQKDEKLHLTFYNRKKEIGVDGVVVQMGPALLSDAALIKLTPPLPSDLQPFTLTQTVHPQEPLSTWGYASHKLYRLENLTFEKDNNRFIRTDFPNEQRKRTGLCGGPLLNANLEVLGVHCGSSPDDKSYAASTRIIPYLLQAYHEGTAEIPIEMAQYQLGTIHIDEQIYYIQCANEEGTLLNNYWVYKQLHQSDILNLLNDPEVRYMKFLLGTRYSDRISRVLVYDKQTGQHFFEPFTSWNNLYD